MNRASSMLMAGTSGFVAKPARAHVDIVLDTYPKMDYIDSRSSISVTVVPESPSIFDTVVYVTPKTLAQQEALQTIDAGRKFCWATPVYGISDGSAICGVVRVNVVDPTPENMIKTLRGETSVEASFIEVLCEQLVIEEEVNLSATLKKITWKVNAHQYTEIELDLGDITVDEVIGLPVGMEFDGYKIKGTPNSGGIYGLVLKLVNGSSITGAIHVSPLQRVK